MKIVYALPENLGFMISLNPEAQARMQATETLLQTLINFLVHLPIQAEAILLATRVLREPSWVHPARHHFRLRLAISFRLTEGTRRNGS
jgi:hypothetical protein